MTDKFEQLKNKYIASFDKKRRDIENIWGTKDMPQLRYLLHKLTGSSGSYGFAQLSQLCTQAETRLIKNHDVSDSIFEDILSQVLKHLEL